MIEIPLIAVPNQSFTFTDPEGVLWELAIKTARRTMCADIVRDGRVLVQGQRIVADAPIIPYRYLSTQGNFAILTPDGELPWWQRFGDTHTLVYLTPEELGL